MALREQRCWFHTLLRASLLRQLQRPGLAHRARKAPSSGEGGSDLNIKHMVFGEGKGIYLPQLPKPCYEIVEMHGRHRLGDAWSRFYNRYHHKTSVSSFCALQGHISGVCHSDSSVVNSVRFGSGLEKALWKHTGSSYLYLCEMSLCGYRPDHCLVPLLSEEQGGTSENKCSQLSCPGCALSPLQG